MKSSECDSTRRYEVQCEVTMTAKNRQLDWRRAHWRVGEGKRPRRRTVRETPIFQSTACSVRRPQAQAAPPYNDSDPNGAPAQSVPCARHVETRPDAAPRPPLSVTVVRYQYENRTVSEQRSCCHIRLTFQGKGTPSASCKDRPCRRGIRTKKMCCHAKCDSLSKGNESAASRIFLLCERVDNNSLWMFSAVSPRCRLSPS